MQKVLSTLLPFVDYCSAGRLDAIPLLDIEENRVNLDDVSFYYEKMSKLYPHIKVFYSTLREIKYTSSNSLSATELARMAITLKVIADRF
ncbi:hypothetical protein [Metabacillus iocasae]|uniref:Uncharacterized protein n=1 Tax=Priestia iocasae TaxID=2291674 RepID=A0ABS2QXG8_9BACI|nr:hypothetical protein [Metabacillus iocasae]MBM7704170.1 hypothetical protein [Metabacillus iocasae]